MRWRTGCARSSTRPTDLTGIVLDCGGIDFIDSQGSAKLGDILDLVDDAGVELRLARLKPAVSAILQRDGVLQRLGADKVHANLNRAVQAQLEARRPPGSPSELTE